MLVWCTVLFNAHRMYNTIQQDCSVGHIITTKLAKECEVNTYGVQVLIMIKIYKIHTYICRNNSVECGALYRLPYQWRSLLKEQRTQNP